MDNLLKILVLVTVVMSFSCKNQDEFPIDEQQLIVTDTIPLKLMNDAKWQANKATQIGMKNIDSIIKNFRTLHRKDFKNLGAILSKETSAIIKQCNMTGEAHDQLHLVLVPMLEQVVLLKEDHELIEKNTALKNIEIMLEAYNQYFKN